MGVSLDGRPGAPVADHQGGPPPGPRRLRERDRRAEADRDFVAASGHGQLRPEPRRFGDRQAPLATIDAMQGLAAQTARDPPGGLGRRGHHGNPPGYAPARLRGGILEGLGGDRRLGEHERQQVLAPTLEAPGLGRLGVGVTLDRLRGELVDVGEDRLGEFVLGFDRDPGALVARPLTRRQATRAPTR